MKDTLIKEYNNLNYLRIPSKEQSNIFNVNFVNGPFLEILGPLHEDYVVTFTDTKRSKVLHKAEINTNMWTRASVKYDVDCLIEVKSKSTNQIVFSHQYNPKGKRVYIHLDSKSIGDTLAWFPYVEEFRKKWECEVITSTFHNDWFESEYPELEFTNPGSEVHNLYAMYSIGWYYNGQEVNDEYVPVDFKKYPLQQTASEILGLKYKEVKPKLAFRKTLQLAPIEGKYAVIAPHASAHAKYWNYPGGWQTIIDYLNEQGYKVVMITQELLGDEWHDSKLGGTLTGVIDKTGDYPLEDRATDLMGADLFIGVGSGLSWLSWALGTKTIMISGFSYPYTEFQDAKRIYPLDNSVCRGCFNREWLNPGDWEWCPDHKDTPRQFECTKTITPQQVIEAIDSF